MRARCGPWGSRRHDARRDDSNVRLRAECAGMSANPVEVAWPPTVVRRLMGLGAMGTPALHTASDLVEWMQGGFSEWQLWLNYVAFLPMPAVMLGLYVVQRSRASAWAMAGAMLYGFAFIYFAHTTLFAIATRSTNYAQLWASLGAVYTAHGALMVVGGLAFGLASARAGVFPAWSVRLFLAGIVANLLLAVTPAPEMLQIAGSALRNAGLVGMGWWLVRSRAD